MPNIELQPIRVRTGSKDTEGRLAFLDGELAAVLVRLDDEMHGSDLGKWFVEALFGPQRRANPFETLADAEAWLKEQITPFRQHQGR
ncbi:MAG TPA: hypothetical protein VGN97_02515 [Mesorhizobium sp.]|nr:hypothetical protein [Mesorhizobium sp.]